MTISDRRAGKLTERCGTKERHRDIDLKETGTKQKAHNYEDRDAHETRRRHSSS